METHNASIPSVGVDLVVVGGGPTGLTAALEAMTSGFSVRVIDRKAAREHYSKALVLHARTMEMFVGLGVADKMRAAGLPFAALNVGGRRSRARIDLMGLNGGDTSRASPARR